MSTDRSLVHLYYCSSDGLYETSLRNFLNFNASSCSVTKLPVSIPNFEWTLEWMLPTPVPLHQFDQAPIVVEVRVT